MTPTERLRALVRDRMTRPCPTCGSVQRMPLRDAATEIGVSHTGLSRFLNGGGIDSTTLDILTAWLETPR